MWTWTALDADTKLIVSYYVGDRSGESAITLNRDRGQEVLRASIAAWSDAPLVFAKSQAEGRFPPIICLPIQREGTRGLAGALGMVAEGEQRILLRSRISAGIGSGRVSTSANTPSRANT